jgi:hypothetical protein
MSVYRDQTLSIGAGATRSAAGPSCGAVSATAGATYDFEANAKEGIAIDWPISYKDIEPVVFLCRKICGYQRLDRASSPSSRRQFLPPYDMTCVEKDVAARLKEHYKGMRHIIIGRVANLTVTTAAGRVASSATNAGWAALSVATSAPSPLPFPPQSGPAILPSVPGLS